MSVNAGVSLGTNRIVSTFDIFKPEVRNRLARTRGRQGLSAFHILTSLGYERPVTQESTTTYEENWIHQKIYAGGVPVATNTLPGGGVDSGANQVEYLMTLDNNTGAGTDSFLALNNNLPYPSAATYINPVRVGDQLLFPKADIVATVAEVVNPTTNTAQIRFVLNQYTAAFVPADYPDGTELIIYSNAHSEGSGQPESKQWDVIQETHYLQIIKEKFRYTGTQATNKAWFDTIEIEGDMAGGYMIKGQEDTEYEMMLAMDGALMFGQPVTSWPNSNDQNTNEPRSTTEGLIPYMNRTANLDTYTPGTWSVADYDNMVKTLDAEFAPHDICGLAGIDWTLENDNVMKDYLQNTNIEYARQALVRDKFNDDEGLAVSVGFNLLIKGDYRFMLNRMPHWSHPQLYGAGGYNYDKMAVFFPMAHQKDAKTDRDMPYFGMMYKKLGANNRRLQIWKIDGQGENPANFVIEDDLSNLNFRAHIGAEHCGGNQMIKISAA